MPITGPSSYVATTDDFIAHWTLANADGTVIVVAPTTPGAGVITLAALTALRTDLVEARADVQSNLNELAVTRETILMQKRILQDRFDEFTTKLRAYYASTAYLPALPMKPTETELSARFITACDDVASLWSQINEDDPPPGITLPLTLPGAYALADFTSAAATLRTNLSLLSQKEQNTTLARTRRNLVQQQIYPILRDYRLAVPALLGKTSPFTTTLPRLSPIPGKTPTAVNASGSFITPSNEAKIIYSASPDTDIIRYELRQSPPPNFETDDETVIATNLPGAPREFLTNAGLLAPGDRSLYKVYAINDTDNEKGSNVVDITWPTP